MENHSFQLSGLVLLMLIGGCGHTQTQNSGNGSSSETIRAQSGDAPEQEMIFPGKGVGNIKIGQPRNQVLISRSTKPANWDDGCGEALTWPTTSRSGIAGNLIARLRGGIVAQIDSANSTFRTADGITADTPPEKIQQNYKHLRAYVSDITDMALGNRPVIYWVDSQKGIAFEFAYFPEERRRYLYAVIVFRPNDYLCPDGNKPNAAHWREIAPYSLESPDRTAQAIEAREAAEALHFHRPGTDLMGWTRPDD